MAAMWVWSLLGREKVTLSAGRTGVSVTAAVTVLSPDLMNTVLADGLTTRTTRSVRVAAWAMATREVALVMEWVTVGLAMEMSGSMACPVARVSWVRH